MRNLGDFKLTSCDLYTTCEPCPMCLGAIYWARPARVFFACVAADAAAVGFDDAFIYEDWTAPRRAATAMQQLYARNRWQFSRCGGNRKRKSLTENNHTEEWNSGVARNRRFRLTPAAGRR